jgi:Tol biopolymer transport system component
VEYPIGTVLYESRGWISHVRVSPRGNTVAFLEHPVYPDDRGSVMVVGSDRRGRGLCSGFASEQGLAWSADGREVWFTASTLGSNRSLYAVDLGGRLRTVTSLPGGGRVHDISTTGEVLLTSDNASVGTLGRGPDENAERELTWLDWSIPAAISRDGRTLLFDEEGEGGGLHYTVCIRGMDGSTPVLLGEGGAEDLSPDGKWALVSRFWVSPPELVLLPTGPGQPRTLPPTGMENIATARFFPSGNQILLVGNEPGHSIRIYVRELEGGAVRPIAPEGIFAREGSISPDGRWVAGMVRGGGASLYPVEGGTPRAIPGTLPDDVILGWSSDGKSVYARTTGELPAKISRIDLATGKRVAWQVLHGPEDRAGVQPGLAILGRDDHTYVYVYGRALSELFLARGLR